MQLAVALHRAAQTDKDDVDMCSRSLSEYSQFCDESLYLPWSLTAAVVETMIKIDTTQSEKAKENIMMKSRLFASLK